MHSISMPSEPFRERCAEISRCSAEEMRGTAGQLSVWRFEPHGLPWPKDIPKTDSVKQVWYRASQEGANLAQLPLLEWDRATSSLVDDNGTAVESFIGVCSHARHDICCGERGKQVLRRIQQFEGVEPVYSCSHLGGDRFAANMVILPEGLLLGRVDELDDTQLEQVLKRESLPAKVIRGRIGVEPVLGATEVWYRQQRQITTFKVGATFTIQENTDSYWRVEICEPNVETITVEARREETGIATHVTCGDEKTSPLQHWVIRELT